MAKEKTLSDYTSEQLQLIGYIEEMLEDLDPVEASEVLDAVKNRIIIEVD